MYTQCPECDQKQDKAQSQDTCVHENVVSVSSETAQNRTMYRGFKEESFSVYC